MRERRWSLGLAAVTLLLLAGTAEAQGIRFGVHGNFGTGLRNPYLTEDGGDANLGGGARIVWELGLHHEGLSFMGSVDVFSAQPKLILSDPSGIEVLQIGGRYYEGNLNATYSWGKEKLNFYVGLGANIANDTLDEDYLTRLTDRGALDVGGNVLFGAKAFDHIFAEARYEIRGGNQIILTLGLLL